MANYCAKGTSVQFFVIRDNSLGERIISPNHDMAAFLTHDNKASARGSFDAGSPGDAREFAHLWLCI